jgi:arsenite-transporting ATPase
VRIILFTGKGGVGKSVISSATALKTSLMGLRTLLISTDPAHTLSDAFGMKIGSIETKVSENLYAIQIDPIYEATKHYSILFEFLSEIFKSRNIDEVVAYEIANFPGATGAAALLKLRDYVKSNNYDVIIIDMIPSGDALRLLYMPYVIGKMSRRFMRIIAPLTDVGRIAASMVNIPMPSREVVETQIELLNMMEDVHKILIDTKMTSLRIIMNPDAFSIENAKRTFIQSSIYGINTDLVIMNKILPDELKDVYFKNWKEAQEHYIKQSEIDFYPIPLKKLRLLPNEVKGRDALEKIANELYDDDPVKIYYEGKPINVVSSEKGVEIILSAPFVKKDELEVERFGDELIIHIETQAGKSTILLPLPAITYKYSLKSAKLINKNLHIYFGE